MIELKSHRTRRPQVVIELKAQRSEESQNVIGIHCLNWNAYMKMWEKQSRHVGFREFFDHKTHMSLRLYSSAAHARNALARCTGINDNNMFEFYLVSDGSEAKALESKPLGKSPISEELEEWN